MSQTEMGFRTAPLGFKRDDVLEFIEEQAEHIRDLEQRVGQLQDDCVQITYEKQEAERATQALIEDRDRVMEEHHAKEQTITSLQSKLRGVQQNCEKLEQEQLQLKEEKEALQKELEDMRAEHSILSAKCAEYEESRARLAEIELYAHARADEVQQRAHQNAYEMITEAEQMAERLLVAIERTKESYRSALVAVERETERAHAQSTDTLAKFDEIMTGLRGRMSQVREHTEQEQQATEKMVAEHLESKQSNFPSKERPTLAQVLGALRGNK